MGIRVCCVFFVFMCSKLLSAKAFSLNLEIAEKMALNKEENRSIYAKETEKQSLLLKKKYFSLLPNLYFSVHGSQGNIFDQNPKLNSEASFSLRAAVPNPFRWLSEKKVIELDRVISSKRIKGEELKVLEAMRKIFFKVSFISEKKQNTEKSLKRIEALEEKTSKKVKQGLSSIYDKKRIELGKRQIRRSLEKLQQELEKLERDLKNQLALKETDKIFILFRKDLKLQDLNKELLLDRLPSSRSHFLIEKDLLYQKGVEVSESKKHFFLPEASLGMRYGLESKLSFEATLTWRIFSGFSSYYDYRVSLLEKEKAYFQFLDEKERFSLSSENKVEELLSLKEDYEVEKKNLADRKEILESSERSFEAGLLAYHFLDADLASYLQQETKVLETYYHLIEVLSEVSTLVGDRNFFYQWFKT